MPEYGKTQTRFLDASGPETEEQIKLTNSLCHSRLSPEKSVHYHARMWITGYNWATVIDRTSSHIRFTMQS